MIEPARIQAAIEILDQVADSLLHDGASADVLVRKYFRTRRYAGSQDRRSVTNHVYKVIRNWGYLSDVAAGHTRKMLLLSLWESHDMTALEGFFSGLEHAPALLTEEEKSFLSEKHEKRAHHELNYPLWLEGRLKSRFADDLAPAMTALNGRAPFELRVNRGKEAGAKVEAFLKDEDISYSKGQWAETAFVLTENPRIESWEIYKKGLIEVQDEAAQLALKISDIQPGQQVMDLCAGAGGKTLAAAAYMENKGQIYAFDNNKYRLKDLKPRAKRADVRVLQSQLLDTAGGKRQNALREHLDRMDRVILDVPCSGSGVWRRNPESKWRLTEEKLAQYCRIQKSLLKEGWGFVKPGGRLIYMTCSLLQDENEQQIESFLEDEIDVKLVPYKGLYKSVHDDSELKTLSSMPDCLALAPHSHGTDGFFVAILEKKA